MVSGCGWMDGPGGGLRPPPLLSAHYAARGTHFAMYFNTGTLPFALCHFALCHFYFTILLSQK